MIATSGTLKIGRIIILGYLHFCVAMVLRQIVR